MELNFNVMAFDETDSTNHSQLCMKHWLLATLGPHQIKTCKFTNPPDQVQLHYKLTSDTLLPINTQISNSLYLSDK